MTGRLASAALASELLAAVGHAAAAFHSRWRMSTLERVDPELYVRVQEQIALYEEEAIAGYEEDLRLQSAAMIRGWSAACRAMEGQPDDAYLVGVDRPSKTRVVISEHREAIEHVRANTPPSMVGYRIIAVSPDELAKLVASNALLVEAKTHFPGAEVVNAIPQQVAL